MIKIEVTEDSNYQSETTKDKRFSRKCLCLHNHNNYNIYIRLYVITKIKS